MVFGKCKVCEEKELRILELKEQVAYFKSILHPEPKTRRYELETEMEADMVLDGGGKNEIDLEAEEKENARIQSETDFIMSGNDERADA